MPKTLEEIVDEYDIDDEDVEALREHLGPKGMRDKLAELGAKAKRVDELETENAGLKLAPKRQKVFEDYGVDLANLKPAEQEAIEGFTWEGDDPDQEKLAAFVERYDLPVIEKPEGQDEEPASGRIAEHSMNTQRRGEGASTKLNADIMAGWSAEKIAAFHEKHKDLADKVLQGEEVPLPSGF